MEDATIDLQLGPAIQVTARQFSIRVDGVQPDQAETVRRRVADALQHRWDMAAVTPERTSSQPDASAERGPIRVGLVGPSTDPARQRELQDVVRAVVADELHSDEAAVAACICASGVPGDRINLTAADIRWFVNGVWTPPPSGASFWTITIRIDRDLSNLAQLILRDGTTFNPPVPKNQALVGLANNREWAKEIWADNLCSGRIGSVFQGGTNSTPRRMLLDRPDCTEGADTIVFRKPGVFGIWYDVGHFPPEIFWQAFGGTWADYTWVLD
jgi:hypothetical protein